MVLPFSLQLTVNVGVVLVVAFGLAFVVPHECVGWNTGGVVGASGASVSTT